MSTATIRILERLVADQIAAGEVVERPGSIVKELVENSLDAGATRIQLDVDAGGVGRLRVLDDGAGIRAEEVELAFERHATSKIRSLADLDHVPSFGFRGEALPSIASVSRVTVRTRTRDSLAGTLVRIEAGTVVERREVGAPVGTEIEVRDLFFNTPARLKFLKREGTEQSHCSEALVRLALLRPDVAFAMKAGGRAVRELPRVERIEERVAGLFGGESLARARGEESAVGVLAILGPPERARAGAGSLYTYVNGRFIRDKALLGAVTQAFGGTLERGRYPVGLIALDVPRAGVDVNVHPQKTEVRFADAQAVYRAVVRVVGDMVSRAVWSFGRSDLPDAVAEPTGEPVPADEPYAPAGRLVPEPPRRQPAARLPERPVAAAPSRSSLWPETEAAAPETGTGSFSRMEYVGQARGLFLVFDDADDLVIVDQHAAHERITYERLKKELASGGIATQRLLMPHNVDLGPADAERIAALADDLLRLGLEVERSGPDRVAIRAVPAELAGAAPDRLLAEIVLALEEGRSGSRGDADERALATMACHGSLRAGRAVQAAEARALLQQMDGIDFAGHCPHGRPALTRFAWREIRRRLGRG